MVPGGSRTAVFGTVGKRSNHYAIRLFLQITDALKMVYYVNDDIPGWKNQKQKFIHLFLYDLNAIEFKSFFPHCKADIIKKAKRKISLFSIPNLLLFAIAVSSFPYFT